MSIRIALSLVIVLLSAADSHAQFTSGGEPDAGSTPGPYACVPLNRDARNPYALALLSGIRTASISGTIYQRMDDCTKAMDAVRSTPAGPLVCSSRDRDGRGPWILGSIQDGRFIRFERAVSTSLDACIKMSNDLIVGEDGTTGTFCSSKNGSGLPPFAIMAVDLPTGRLELGNSFFNDLAKCNRNLGLPN
jgi:hypothetical protein